MSTLDPESLETELSGLRSRLTELRAARPYLEREPEAALDAMFLELDSATEMLTAALTLLGERAEPAAGRGQQSGDRDRQLLRSVFQDLPVPVMLMEPDGRIRRVNHAGAELLDVPADYAASKPFASFVELTMRAVFRSQLAAVVRDAGTRTTELRLLSAGQPVDVLAMTAALDLPRDSHPLVVAVLLPRSTQDSSTEPAAVPGRPGAASEVPIPDRQAVDIQVRNADLTNTATRLLLGESGHGEAVIARAVVRLLAEQLSDWAILDIARSGGLSRVAVAGPSDEASERTERGLSRAEIGTDDLPMTVFADGRTVIDAHVENLGLLGANDARVPFLVATGAHSVLAVPVLLQDEVLGVLTLLRRQGNRPFGLADQALAEQIAAQLGLSIRAERDLHRRSELASVLQAGLVPRSLPDWQGLGLASVYRMTTTGGEFCGDFYDVFDCLKGWGIAVGGMSGYGRLAVAATTQVRHGVRLLSRTAAEPGHVLNEVHDALRDQLPGDNVVCAVAGHLQWEDDQLSVVLASAGQLPGVLRRADGQLEHVGGGGTALGTESTLHIDVHEVRLGVGDYLVLGSPGLFEVRSPLGQQLGDTGQVAATISSAIAGNAGELATAIDALVTQFTGGELDRDLAVLVVHVEHAPGPGYRDASTRL